MRSLLLTLLLGAGLAAVMIGSVMLMVEQKTMMLIATTIVGREGRGEANGSDQNIKSKEARMKAYRRKYRGYWIKVELKEKEYIPTIWISGHLFLKEHLDPAYSAGLAERQAELHIDKILYGGGVLT